MINEPRNNKIASTKDVKHVLITDTSHDYLMKIYNDKCVGVVNLYTDEDDDMKVCGEFRANNCESASYSWQWAHKIYYSYQRLTSDVGKSEDKTFFEGEDQVIYIFNNLSEDDISVIRQIVKEKLHLFEITKEDETQIQFLADTTHNFYAAWERVMMKYHIYCNDYDAYLCGAREQLASLKDRLLERNADFAIISKLNHFVENTEEFGRDNEVRKYLLDVYKSYITLK